MSPSPSTVVYHVLPQAPAILSVSPSSHPSNIELDGDENDQTAILPPPLETRISWVLFMLGCAVLLPWNVMINAIPYFLSRLDGSSLQSTFASYLSSSFTASNFLFLAHATATSKQTSSASWILFTTIWLSFWTALLTLSTFVHLSPEISFAFVLLNGVAQAAAGAYLQTAVVAVASVFGPSAMQAVMSGQAAVAVVISGVQVLATAASVWGLPEESISTFKIDSAVEERSAFVFFGLSTLFLVATTWAIKCFVALPAYHAAVAPLARKSEASPDGRNSDEQQGLVSSGRGGGSDKRRRILRVAKANVIYHFAVALVFIVTLSVYPPVTISIQPMDPRTHPVLFNAIHFLLFNVGDLLGRYICAFPHLRVWSSKSLLLGSLLRMLFIPLFLMCNVQRSPASPLSSPIISSDALFMLILLGFGLSNGYISSMCMMAAPSLEHNPRLKGRRDDVDDAATVASFCLIGGLTIGSIMSFAVRGAICSCNPFRA